MSSVEPVNFCPATSILQQNLGIQKNHNWACLQVEWVQTNLPTCLEVLPVAAINNVTGGGFEKEVVLKSCAGIVNNYILIYRYFIINA